MIPPRGNASGLTMAAAALFAVSSVPGEVSVGVSAFQPLPTTLSTAATTAKSTKSHSPLFANSKNIKAAMEATERYGIHSPQAKLAWEVVEEFDASTNDSAAYTPTEGAGLTPQELQQAYQDVQTSMDIMQRNQYAAVSFQNNQQLMKDVAAELKAIKLSPPTKKPPPKIPGLWDSKLKARALTQQFGAASVEAKLAWEEVEEIASSGLENAVGGTLFEEDSCDLVQAAEACMALEELDRFLYYENYHAADTLENTIVDESSMMDNYHQNYNEGYGGDYNENYSQEYTENYTDNYNNYNENYNQGYTDNTGGGTYH